MPSRAAAVGTLLACLAAPAAAADEHWMLMARHGECAEVASLKRKVPDLGEIGDPYSFANLMRQKGHRVTSSEVAGAGGKAVEVRVPEMHLYLIFVAPERCEKARARP